MFRRIAIVLTLLSACQAQDNVSRMEQVVQSYVAGKQFMGTVLIARDGEVLLSKGYGSANLSEVSCTFTTDCAGRTVPFGGTPFPI